MKVNKNLGATGQSNLKNSGKNNNEVIYKVHNREQLDGLWINIQQLWTKKNLFENKINSLNLRHKN